MAEIAAYNVKVKEMFIANGLVFQAGRRYQVPAALYGSKLADGSTFASKCDDAVPVPAKR